jgi:hypothetical protein
MGAIDNLISIAAERKTFLTSEKIIRLSRLIISLDKIINSFKENANNPIAPQMVHIQIIEDILYKDPHFFDDELIEHFFSLKNDLDAEIATFPFDSNKHKPIFDDLKERASEKRKQLRKREKIESYIIYAVIVILTLKFIF